MSTAAEDEVIDTLRRHQAKLLEQVRRLEGRLNGMSKAFREVKQRVDNIEQREFRS